MGFRDFKRGFLGGFKDASVHCRIISRSFKDNLGGLSSFRRIIGNGSKRVMRIVFGAFQIRLMVIKRNVKDFRWYYKTFKCFSIFEDIPEHFREFKWGFKGAFTWRFHGSKGDSETFSNVSRIF